VSARPHGWQSTTAIATAGGLLSLAVVPPLASLAVELAGTPGSAGLLAGSRLWALLGRTVLLAAAVTAVAVVVGVPLGLSFARASFPGRRALFALHLFVAFLPPFLPALGWFRLFGRSGLLASESLSAALFSGAGAVFVLASCLAPIVTALTWIGLLGIEPSVEEAARVVAGPMRTAVGILIPIASKAIALGGLVVFALSVSELGVPMFLRVDVYPCVVFSRLGGMDFAPGEAAVFVLPLLCATVALFAVEHWGIGRGALGVSGVRHGHRTALFHGANAVLPAAVAVCGATFSAAPLVALSLHAWARGGFFEVVRWMGEAPWNSVRAAGTAALASTAIAVVVGHAAARGDRRGRAFDSLAALAFLVPSPILGIGLIGAWNRPSTAWVYGGFGILVVGLVAKYTVVATRTISAIIAQTPMSLEDAGRAAGAGYFRRLWSVVLQLNGRGIAGATMLVLVFSLRDLDTAVLFYPPGGEPLTVRIFTLEANGPPGVVSALALIHVALTAAVLAVAAVLLRFRRTA
jgi:iron(III) transport system permease protein